VHIYIRRDAERTRLLHPTLRRISIEQIFIEKEEEEEEEEGVGKHDDEGEGVECYL